MKKRIFLMLMLGIISLSISNVDAKVVSKDEIENNSYVIGNYYYTRTPNSDNKYDGSLTTPEIMLAANTIYGGLDKMIIYHKDFLGNWINGLTGEQITPPSSFDITNRNLADIMYAPTLDCRWLTDSEQSIAQCFSSYYYIDNNDDDDNLDMKNKDATYVYDTAENVMTTYDNELKKLDNPKNYGVEVYLLKNSNGEVFAHDVYFNVEFGKFMNSLGEVYTPTLLEQEAYDNSKLYNLVSRYYYLDGEEKIYSEYSNIVNNGAYSNVGITSSKYPTLKATLTDLSLVVPKSLNPIYYNVKFELKNYDTTNYKIKGFKVYRNSYGFIEDESMLTEGIANKLQSFPTGNDTYLDLFLNNSYDKKYVDDNFYTRAFSETSDNTTSGIWKLVAEVDGKDAFGKINDVSGETAYSVKFDSDGSDNELVQDDYKYIADIEFCDRYNSNRCYTYRTHFTTAQKES